MQYFSGHANIPTVKVALVLPLKSFCSECQKPHETKVLWVVTRGKYKAIPIDGITILQAVNKLVEVWAGGQVVGSICSANGGISLVNIAERIGGEWLRISRSTLVRPWAITEVRQARRNNGGVLVIHGMEFESSRRCWPEVKHVLGLPRDFVTNAL